MELKEFIEKFAEEIEIENSEALDGTSKFHELEEWSSVSVMLTIAFFDQYFDKEVNGGDIKKCETLEDLYHLATE